VPLIAWGCASTAAITSGQYDSVISNFAAGLKSFGHPVFLRWFWEMNLPTTKAVTCLGSGGSSGFIAAWRHVWGIFHRVGATNVAFVWCPSLSRQNNLVGFFPGATYVDWIGVDGYDHSTTGTFASLFGSWYSAFAGYGKPLMVAETGAMAAQQAQYLQSILSEVPASFPDLKALVYFDAKGTLGVWVLAGAGVSAFHQLATSSYFSFRA
jgi:beta-mannanase